MTCLFECAIMEVETNFCDDDMTYKPVEEGLAAGEADWSCSCPSPT